MQIKCRVRSLLLSSAMIASIGAVCAQQKAIPRIDAMPNKPSPYETFDWKALTKSYDATVFDTKATEEYFPLTTISTEEGINYPSIHNIRMSNFVGQDSKTTAEAINILPALIGSSLVGINKANQDGTDWVAKSIDFFNKKNGQNVYLNNYSTVTGNDWWYETMPNVYFYQLYNLYPKGSDEFASQFESVANRQLSVVYKLGGSEFPWQYPDMNYRSFNFETEKGIDTGVKEPEAAGSIAWILYQAYLKTQNQKYLIGSQLALDFLQNTTENPSYELQLPYGIQAAAKLNAIENTEYDIDKFLNWAFSDGTNTLRGWGAIVGNWNGYDMSGLIGEAKDKGNDYAFLMNGFQHAAALAPVAKYDKRYAKALGKWLLNLSNASRFFYPGSLPDANMESTSLAWSKKYNPSNNIPYESIKENIGGTKPYATGDALSGGWAPTNLSLYSGSSVGYLAALVSNTNVEGILQIDLNATDFGQTNNLNTYLYYNPNTKDEKVTLTLPSGNFNIYDAITETTLSKNVTGNVEITIPQNDVRIIVLYPANLEPTEQGKLWVLNDGRVLDYHYKWNYTPTLRIKSLYSSKNEIMTGEKVQINALTANTTSEVNFEWYVNGQKQANTTQAFEWTADDKTGEHTIKCIAQSANQTATDSISINVISSSQVTPEITEISLSGSNPYNLSETIAITAKANTTDTIEWNCSGGELKNIEALTPEWVLPEAEGIYTLTLTVKNKQGRASKSVDILVKNTEAQVSSTPVAYYPMDGNLNNAESDGLNAVSVGAVLATNPLGEANKAYRFENKDQYIYTPNDALLNFQDQLTLSFWFNPAKLGEGEQFVLSHGSWEERYKVSLTPEKKIRFTINTTDRIVDIDDPTLLENDKYVHYTFVFTGYSVEIYRDGKLATFTKLGGKINKSTKALTMGRKDEATSDYTYTGSIDEVRLYNTALDIKSIAELPTIFQDLPTNNVEIQKLTIDGAEWDIENKFILDCGNTKSTVTVQVEPFAGAKMDKNTFEVNVSKPSIQNVSFTITSEDGSASKEYTLKVEVPFKGSDIVSQKWNKVLTVNNNSETNGGFSFTGYQWFKNDVLVSKKQYYSAGNKPEEILDPTAVYSVVMTMNENDEIHVCPFQITPQSTVSVNVYPTQVSKGEKICIDAEMEAEMLRNSNVDVYSLEGNFIKKVNIVDSKTYFELYDAGIYVLKYEAQGGYQNSFKLIVK